MEGTQPLPHMSEPPTVRAAITSPLGHADHGADHRPAAHQGHDSGTTPPPSSSCGGHRLGAQRAGPAYDYLPYGPPRYGPRRSAPTSRSAHGQPTPPTATAIKHGLSPHKLAAPLHRTHCSPHTPHAPRNGDRRHRGDRGAPERTDPTPKRPRQHRKKCAMPEARHSPAT